MPWKRENRFAFSNSQFNFRVFIYLVRGQRLGVAEQLSVEILCPVPTGVLQSLGKDGDLGYVGDRGQGLPSEAVGGDGGQVVEGTELGGRETLAEDREIVLPDPCTVVSDLRIRIT